ncbi:MAG: ABC transporter permease [Syntrophorhabdaceae bacterium]
MREEAKRISTSRPADDALVIHLAGSWTMADEPPDDREIADFLESGHPPRLVRFDTSAVSGWDSTLITFLVEIGRQCSRLGLDLQTDGLPEGLKRLLKLAVATPEREGASRERRKESFFSRVGGKTLNFFDSFTGMLNFLGDASYAIARFVTGRANFRRADLMLFLQESGSQAFAIVSLISLLVGLILAFVGAVQLKTFGAQIYVADLVAVAMVRVMGAIMTGIIMAGRTGASYAAQLGTMQVNEEIDALKTLGISPMEFLVLPRMLALIIMMPVLCVYADVMGILGGLIVGTFMLDVNPIVYLNQTRAALSLTNVWIGLTHAAVFGVIVALAGCLRGIQCGRSASAVGYATTSAVVTGIVSIIIATAIITIIANVLGI